jgi:hypothetical protein
MATSSEAQQSKQNSADFLEQKKKKVILDVCSKINANLYIFIK